MARKRLLGPSVRQAPRLDDGELTERPGAGLRPHELLEAVRWEGAAVEEGVAGVEVVRSAWWASGSRGSS
jgi:hypothetical protein